MKGPQRWPGDVPAFSLRTGSVLDVFCASITGTTNSMCKPFSLSCDVNRSRNSQLGPRLSRPLHLPAHSGPMVQMTITHQGAAAHLVGEEEEAVASIPLVDWSSERKTNAAKTHMNWH